VTGGIGVGGLVAVPWVLRRPHGHLKVYGGGS
jgi:hypothetical protein